jgi:hypothetical protein
MAARYRPVLRTAPSEQRVIAICPIVELEFLSSARERLTVLCDDRDYQTVATITGQPVKLVTDV